MTISFNPRTGHYTATEGNHIFMAPTCAEARRLCFLARQAERQAQAKRIPPAFVALEPKSRRTM